MDDDLRQEWLTTLTVQLGVIETALHEATTDVAAIRHAALVPSDAFEAAAAPLRRSLPLVRSLVDRLSMGSPLTTADQTAYLRWIHELSSALDGDGPASPCTVTAFRSRRDAHA